MNIQHPTLFSPYTLGSIELKNRIVMAPMTRSRAVGNVPNELMAKYYADRADAGLIITEGTSPSPNGLGYARIPGIYSTEQQEGWKAIADAVHAKGGKIFMQLMHTGRVSHLSNMPEGAHIAAPSAIAADGQMWTDRDGMQQQPVPQEIPLSEIPALIGEYVHSAKAAIEAGFDGVEIHAANGYLPMQFLNPGANQRKDAYGGSPEARNRFVLGLAAAIAGAIGKDKTGIRLSPFNKFNDMAAFEEEQAQYTALAQGLQDIGLIYLHLLTFSIPESMMQAFYDVFTNPIMLNGGYTADQAEADLSAGKASLISFGSPYIANPDLARRLAAGTALATPDQSTFYTPGEKGYTDYPVAMEATGQAVA